MNEPTTKEETPKAHAAFLAYCEMGYGRSLEKLAHKLGKPSAYTRCLETWSSVHHWQERVKHYDAEQANQRRAEEARQRKEDEEAVRRMLLEHVQTKVEASSTSQIQAAKLLMEHFAFADRLKQMEEQQALIMVALKELEAHP